MSQIISPEISRQVLLYYDSAGYYAYVLLRSSDSRVPVTQDEVENAKRRLREKGISPVLSGKSYRPASNGKQYEWYIRVTERGVKPSREKVTRVLREISGGYDEKPSQETQAFIKQLLETIEHERQTNRDLQLQLQNVDSARRTLEEETSHLREEVRRLETTVQGLAEEHSFFEQELLEERDSLKAENDQLRSQVQSVSTEKDNAQWERDYYRDEYHRLEAEYKGLQSVLSAESIPAQAAEDDFEKLLGCLLPEVVFVKGSMTLLRNEVRYELALRKIRAIVHDNIKPDDTIKRQGYPTWYEYHFSTGQGRKQGRIYSTRAKNGKYIMLVSQKETQKQDIEGLWDIQL